MLLDFNLSMVKYRAVGSQSVDGKVSRCGNFSVTVRHTNFDFQNKAYIASKVRCELYNRLVASQASLTWSKMTRER